MLGFGIETFEGFAPSDFDAFQERKWRSNRFNLERMAVRDKLRALSAAVLERLPELAEGLDAEACDHTPSIFNSHRVDAGWLCFRRPPAGQAAALAAAERARSMERNVRDPQPLHGEVLLCVRVNEQGVEVGLRLHANARVDADAFLGRCRDEGDGARWATLLGALPAGVQLAIGEHEVDGAPAFDSSTCDRLAAMMDAGEGWLALRQLFPRDAAALADDGFVTVVCETMAALLPLRAFIASDAEDLEGAPVPKPASEKTAAPARPSEPAPAETVPDPAALFADLPERRDDADDQTPREALPLPTISRATESFSSDDRLPEWARVPARPAVSDDVEADADAETEETPADESTEPVAPVPIRASVADDREPVIPREDRLPEWARGGPAAAPSDDAAEAEVDEVDEVDDVAGIEEEKAPALSSEERLPEWARGGAVRPRAEAETDADADAEKAPTVSSEERVPAWARGGPRPAASASKQAPAAEEQPRAGISDEDRLPEWARFKPAPQPARPERPRRGPRRGGQGGQGGQGGERDGGRGRGGDRRDGGRGRSNDRRRDGRSGDGRRDGRRGDGRRGEPRTYELRPVAKKAPKTLTPSDKGLTAGCNARVLDGLFVNHDCEVVSIDARGEHAQVLIHKRTVRMPVSSLQRLD